MGERQKDVSPKIHMWLVSTRRCLAPVVIRKIQLKTTMREHFSPLRMALTKNQGKQHWQGGKASGTVGWNMKQGSYWENRSHRITIKSPWI